MLFALVCSSGVSIMHLKFLLTLQEKLKERERELRKRKEREEQEMERVKIKVRRKEVEYTYRALLVEMIKDPKVKIVIFSQRYLLLISILLATFSVWSVTIMVLMFNVMYRFVSSILKVFFSKFFFQFFFVDIIIK